MGKKYQNVPKTTNLAELRLIGRKYCDFCLLEHAVFPNVGFLSIFEIFNGFSANIFKNFPTPFCE